MWTGITNSLIKEEYVPASTPYTKVEQKWKNLKAKYTNVISHNNVSGNDRKICPLSNDKLADAIGDRPNVRSKILVSSAEQSEREVKEDWWKKPEDANVKERATSLLLNTSWQTQIQHWVLMPHHL